MDPTKPKRFYLMTYPRTSSNLFVKILNMPEQEKFTTRQSGGYFFLPVTYTSHSLGLFGKNIDDWSDDERTQMSEAYHNCAKDLEDFVLNGDGTQKDVFIKEHCTLMLEPTARDKFVHGEDKVKEQPWPISMPGLGIDNVTRTKFNDSLLPDDFLRTLFPTFLIRHPALAFPSFVRAFADINAVTGQESNVKTELGRRETAFVLTCQWTRRMYEWYKLNLTEEQSYCDGDVTWPLIIESEDVIHNPAVMMRFAELTGMDQSKLQYQWDTFTAEALGHGQDPIGQRMLSTLTASTGIIKSKSPKNIDIAEEGAKWREEFGEDVGVWLEETVRKSMPDYEYLKARRLQPKLAN